MNPSPEPPPAATPPAARLTFLDRVERIGNKLPDPTLIFIILGALCIVMSAIGAAAGWQVQPVRPQIVTVEKRDASGSIVLDSNGQAVREPKKGPDGQPEVTLVPSGQPITPRSLLTSEGLYWMLSSMLRNFTSLPALGLIFTAILGIGLAEKFGFFSALMRALAVATPASLLTPVIVLLGANASVASDAGYIILPPLAAALFHAVGRHPVAGLAAAFAGVAGGFGAGFFPTGGDGALTGFAQDAARIIDPAYQVNILHNLYFKIGSAITVTLAGWYVTDRIVEPRLQRVATRTTSEDPEQKKALRDMSLQPHEKRALAWSLAALVLVLGAFAAMIYTPGLPLHGVGQPTLADGRVLAALPAQIQPAGPPPAGLSPQLVLARDPLLVTESNGRRALIENPAPRWSQVIVPIIFFAFLIPGLVYGALSGTLRSQKDLVAGFYSGIQSIVPVLVIAFFMAQFVNYFAYSRLDRLLAYAGGSLLVQIDLPVPFLLILFVILVILGDFAIGGMLSKFGVLAPIFIPMFMMVGISPELTTAAYRIGDSVVNIITPLNSYLLIILVVLQKYQKDAGLGSLISLMLPYSLLFATVWTAFLLGYYWTDLPLGPASPMHYTPKP